MTTVLNAISSAYPDITNRIKASIYLQSSPNAFIASIIDSTAGHPIRTWSFPGLPRNNYGFVLQEIDLNEDVVSVLASFDVVPGEIDGLLSRADEQIQVDTTVGLTSGDNEFTFDGTGGKRNYIGWDIIPSELTGRGILVRDLDYSWDINSGKFLLLIPADVFQTMTWYNIAFNNISSPIAGNSYPTINDFKYTIITNDYQIVPEDFGNKIIIEPSGNYLEMSLPDIDTVIDGRTLMIEVSKGDISCVKFVPKVGQIINFLNGNLYAIPGESFKVYKITRSVGVYEWRLMDVFGNFSLCGSEIGNDLSGNFMSGYQELNGTIGDILTHARIYNEIVMKLPISRVLQFIDWGLSDSTFSKYSYADNTGKFHFPQRKGLFPKNTLTDDSGDYQPDQVGQFTGNIIVPRSNTAQGQDGTGRFTSGGGLVEPRDMDPFIVTFNTAMDTHPKNYSINKYVIL
jgi:hypothetical protein